jgi:hypothetical protein
VSNSFLIKMIIQMRLELGDGDIMKVSEKQGGRCKVGSLCRFIASGIQLDAVARTDQDHLNIRKSHRKSIQRAREFGPVKRQSLAQRHRR